MINPKGVSRDFRKLNPHLFPTAGIQAHETDPRGEVPNPKPKRDKAAALERAAAREAQSLHRTRIRFIGYRVRPLDPDNFAGSVKDLLDGLRHAQLIPGDEPWRIALVTEQVCVRSYRQERTVIEIEWD